MYAKYYVVEILEGEYEWDLQTFEYLQIYFLF